MEVGGADYCLRRRIMKVGEIKVILASFEK